MNRKTYRWERKIHARELWNLDDTIARFILPRLKLHKEQNTCYPGVLESDKWDEILDKMIQTFEKIIVFEGSSKDYCLDPSIKEGLDLFSHWLSHLWD